jgi:hypothetical protein
MRVRVEVSQGDIEAGMAGAACECPVALAIRRACGVEWARVGYDALMGCATIQIGQPSVFSKFHIGPRAVKEFFQAFDDGKAVSPFSFDLDVPDEEVSRGS